MPTLRDEQLDLSFFNRSLQAFYPQYPVAVIQVKIDPAMGKGLLQEANDLPGHQLILDIVLH